MIQDLLSDLGWSAQFARQVAPDEPFAPARIAEVLRASVVALTPSATLNLTVPDETGLYAVGDWILTDGLRVIRRLDRTTEIVRRAAGHGHTRQLIAANVNTIAIVTSCNADFNIARLERYLALASSAGCLPLIVLTRADENPDFEDLVRQVRRLSPLVTAFALDARTEADRLVAWCGKGQTLALVGSSGVGKTTLQNGLTGTDAPTQDIREGDARGRHTTTSRALRRTLAGGWLIDTPGMRELRLSDAADAIGEVFQDITDLVPLCHFRDCTHETEPGCAVREAVARGDVDQGRLDRWRKLMREDAHAVESRFEMRARTRKLSRLYRSAAKAGRKKRGD